MTVRDFGRVATDQSRIVPLPLDRASQQSDCLAGAGYLYVLHKDGDV